MRKKQIVTIAVFTIVLTYFAIYFQWAEFYKGYSLSDFNFFVSIIFLSIWAVFSFYWGITKEKKYQKFIIVYGGINIITSIVIGIFSNNQFIQLLLYPFYIWYAGPLYGFRHILNLLNILNIDVASLMLITSPLIMLSCFLGYWCGDWVSKLKKS